MHHIAGMVWLCPNKCWVCVNRSPHNVSLYTSLHGCVFVNHGGQGYNVYLYKLFLRRYALIRKCQGPKLKYQFCELSPKILKSDSLLPGESESPSSLASSFQQGIKWLIDTIFDWFS